MSLPPHTVAVLLRTTMVAAVLFASLGKLSAAAGHLIYWGVVTRVIDGDTVWVRSAAANETLKVRIVGIDAPEGCQNGGAASRAALAQRVKGQSVKLVASHRRSHDDYGRLLARLEMGDEDMGSWMVENGHAWSYSYRTSRGPYIAEQVRAMAGARGLFSDTTAENPRDFRKRHGRCYDR